LHRANTSSESWNKEVWPEIDVYVPVDEKVRLFFLFTLTRARETRDNVEGQFGAHVDYTQKGFKDPHLTLSRAASGRVPFYDLRLYGTMNDLRGYTAGRFQDRRMFPTQGEYRVELPKRFGLVAFGGFGGGARDYNEFRSDELLPAAGAGGRFRITKESHVNFRG
jgi:hypothetical protein